MWKQLAVVCQALLLLSHVGCHYYEEFREKKGNADVLEERAELMRAYRTCVQKYEGDPPKAKEYCAPYTQMLREVEIKRLPTK